MFQEFLNAIREGKPGVWLRNSQLRDEDWVTLQAAVRGSDTLESLELINCNIGEAQVQAVIAAIHKHPSLKHLSLASNKFGNGLKTLIEQVGQQTHLESLTLSDCGISSDLVIGLEAELAKCHSLKYLNLAGNELTDSACAAVARAVQKQGTIEELDLSRSNLGADASEFFTALQEVKSLREIVLNNNNVSGQSLFALGVFLHQTQLKTLWLCGDPLTATDVVQLLAIVKTTPSITQLGLTADGADLGSNALACQMLAELLASTQLTTIDLSNTAINVAVAKQIAIALNQNKSLQEINLDRCSLSGEGAAVIFDALTNHPTLEVLAINDNALDQAAKNALFRMISKCKKIAVLELSGISFTEDELQKLLEAVKANNTLDELLIDTRINNSSSAKTLIKSIQDEINTKKGFRELGLFDDDDGSADELVALDQLSGGIATTAPISPAMTPAKSPAPSIASNAATPASTASASVNTSAVTPDEFDALIGALTGSTTPATPASAASASVNTSAVTPDEFDTLIVDFDKQPPADGQVAFDELFAEAEQTAQQQQNQIEQLQQEFNARLAQEAKQREQQQNAGSSTDVGELDFLLGSVDAGATGAEADQRLLDDAETFSATTLASSSTTTTTTTSIPSSSAATLRALGAAVTAHGHQEHALDSDDDEHDISLDDDDDDDETDSAANLNYINNDQLRKLIDIGLPNRALEEMATRYGEMMLKNYDNKFCKGKAVGTAVFALFDNFNHPTGGVFNVHYWGRHFWTQGAALLEKLSRVSVSDAQYLVQASLLLAEAFDAARESNNKPSYFTSRYRHIEESSFVRRLIVAKFLISREQQARLNAQLNGQATHADANALPETRGQSYGQDQGANGQNIAAHSAGSAPFTFTFTFMEEPTFF